MDSKDNEVETRSRRNSIVSESGSSGSASAKPLSYVQKMRQKFEHFTDDVKTNIKHRGSFRLSKSKFGSQNTLEDLQKQAEKSSGNNVLVDVPNRAQSSLNLRESSPQFKAKIGEIQVDNQKNDDEFVVNADDKRQETDNILSTGSGSYDPQNPPTTPIENPSTIETLISTEEIYVQNLKAGINRYINIFEMPELPSILRGKKCILFWNLKNIVEFHENTVLPMLRQHQEDVALLCLNFKSFFEIDDVYQYIEFAINKLRLNRLLKESSDFFESIHDEHGDEIGMQTLLDLPIQRLKEYKLIFLNMLAEIYHSQKNDAVRLSCELDATFQNFYRLVENAIKLSYIENCDINVLHCGKLKDCGNFRIYDYAIRRRYEGRLFVFDKCILYTEIIINKDLELLELRGYYKMDEMGFVSGDTFFTLYCRIPDMQKCEFQNKQSAVMEKWQRNIKKLMTGYYLQKVDLKRSKSMAAEVRKSQLRMLQLVDDSDKRLSTSHPRNSRKLSAVEKSVIEEDIINRVLSFPNNEITTRHSLPPTPNPQRHSVRKHLSCHEERSDESEDDKYRSCESDSFDEDFDPNEIIEAQSPRRKQSELRDNTLHPIEELITTEQNYVETLKSGLQRYNMMFKRNDLPPSLRGKQFAMFGNLGQILEFHETVLLPMLERYRTNISRLCQEFINFIEEGNFYAYVLYTINRTRSLKLCKQHKAYIKKIQEEFEDKLGLDSLLMQAVQRLPRYQMLFKDITKLLFTTDPKNRQLDLGGCAKLQKHLLSTLAVVNGALEIQSIKNCNDLNPLYQGFFKKCNKFYIYDYTERRAYHSKAFIFDRCLIYTEIQRGDRLKFRGYYPYQKIGYLLGKKAFTLYKSNPNKQKCDFVVKDANQGDSFMSTGQILDSWLNMIKDMILLHAEEEKRKLNDKYYQKNEVYRRPGSINSSRNSRCVDSGIGSISSTSSDGRPISFVSTRSADSEVASISSDSTF